MSPVVVLGFAAIDAAVIGQAAYAYSDFHRRSSKESPKRKK